MRMLHIVEQDVLQSLPREQGDPVSITNLKVMSTRESFADVLGTIAILTSIATSSSYAAIVDPSTELGAAGPGFWAVLDNGHFNLSNPNGFIHGNVGEATGNFTDGGSAGVSGTIFLGSGVGHNTVAGDVLSLNSTLPASALTQANVAAAYYNGLAADFTTPPSAGAVTPGVYKISGNWSPNGGTYNLTPGQIYVFDISGDFKPSTAASALLFNDSTPWDVIFNVAGKVQSTGGSSTFPNLDGILLAQDSISLTPGFVEGEIISQTSVNIASQGAVQGITVPDRFDTLILFGLASVTLLVLRLKLICPQ